MSTLKRIILNCFVISTLNVCASNQANDEKKIAIYFRPYNVVWTHGPKAIIGELGNFIRNHKLLTAKLSLFSTLIPQALYKTYQGQALPQFCEFFDSMNPTGEIKELAHHIVVDTKQELPGSTLIEWCIDQSLAVSCITNQASILFDRIKNRFPIFNKVDNIIQKIDTGVYRETIEAETANNSLLILPRHAKTEDIESAKAAGFHLALFDKDNPAKSIEQIKLQIEQLSK